MRNRLTVNRLKIQRLMFKRWIAAALIPFLFCSLFLYAAPTMQASASTTHVFGTWTSVPSGTPYNLNSVTYANGEFMAVGDNGTILTSADGMNWTPEPSGTTNSLSTVAYSGGEFGITGQGTWMVSKDGITWSTPPSTVLPFQGIAQGSGTSVEIQGNSLVTSGSTSLYVSHPILHSVVYGDGKFVALGTIGTQQTVILTATDGVGWQLAAPTTITTPLYGLTYANGQFVAVGDNGTVVTSETGLGWTTQPVGTNHDLRSIVYANGKFVAVGVAGAIEVLTPPSLSAATVDGTSLRLTYDEALSSSGSLFPGVVTVDGTQVTVNKWVVQGNTVQLTLASAVNAGDTVTVSHYVRPGLALYSNTAGIVAPALTSQTVNNVTGASAAVTGVTLSQGTMTLTAGGATGTLTATVAPANATNQGVSWSSGNPAVATVDGSGVVTPKSAGTTTITVTTVDGGYAATCAVTVNPAVIGLITATPSAPSVPAGGSVTVTGVVYDANHNAVSGVKVNLTSSTGTFVGSNSMTVITDASGSFEGTWTAPKVSVETAATVTASVYGTSVASIVLPISIYPISTPGTGGTGSAAVTLSNLTLSNGALTPVFSSSTTSYTASVPYTTSSINVTPMLADSTATMTVNGTAATNGSAVTVPLSVEANSITVVVTAKDGSTQTYTVDVTRTPSAPTGLEASTSTSTGTTLTWTAEPGATSYNVYENGTKIDSTRTNNSQVTNLIPGMQYTFTVTAVNAGGESGQSAVATVKMASIGTIMMTVDNTNVFSGSTVTVTGVVYDANSVSVPFAVVDFTGTSGTLGSPSVTANVYGQFTENWTAPIVNTETPETVTATVYGTVYGPVTTNVIPTTLSFEVSTMPNISTMTLPDGTVGSLYSQTLDAVNGFAPYQWSVTSGNLPPGLTLDASKGVISGAPIATGTNHFTVQIKDMDGNTATQSLSITVNAVPTYIVTYNGNGATGGTVPTDRNTYTEGSSVTVLGNTGNLAKTGYTFAGWNTSPDGSGTSYAAGSPVTMRTSDVTLYAQWRANSSGGSSGGFSGGGTGGGSGSTGGNTSSGSNTNTSPELPTVVTSHMFSSDGGTIQKNQGNTMVDINVPQGAFTQPETLTVTAATPTQVTHWVSGLSKSSVAVVLGVNFSGATPTKPVTVTITNPIIMTYAQIYKLTSDGGLVPIKASISAGKAVVSFTSDPDFVVLNVEKGQRIITMAGQARIVPGWVQTDPLYGNKTTYMPIWYVMQMLKTLKINSTWDGDNWKLTTENHPILEKTSPGKGSMHLYLNGTLVQNVTGVYAKDPTTGKNTTYMPIWYVMQLLKTLNISSSWDGMTWTVTNNAAQSGNTSSAS